MTSDSESNGEKKRRPNNKYEKIRSALRPKDSDPKINDKKDLELRKMRRFLHKQKLKKDEPSKVLKPMNDEKKAKALKFLPLGAIKARNMVIENYTAKQSQEKIDIGSSDEIKTSNAERDAIENKVLEKGLESSSLGHKSHGSKVAIEPKELGETLNGLEEESTLEMTIIDVDTLSKNTPTTPLANGASASKNDSGYKEPSSIDVNGIVTHEFDSILDEKDIQRYANKIPREKRIDESLSWVPSVQSQKTMQDSDTMKRFGGTICRIKVLGVGDSGNNALNRLMNEYASIDDGIEYWSVNSDASSLRQSQDYGCNIALLGPSTLGGKGTKGKTYKGMIAASESLEDITTMVEDSEVCIVTTGLGRGLGSGAAPAICTAAKQNGALTIAVVTKPFPFEGRKLVKEADDAVDILRETADAVIVISNSNVLQILPVEMSIEASFRVVDEIINQVIVGILDLLTKTDICTVQFSDVKSVLGDGGISFMGMGTGVVVEDATLAALTSPLLLEGPLEQADGILVSIVGGQTLSLRKIDAVLKLINKNVNDDANVVVGAHCDERLANDAIIVTLIATSFKTEVITRNIRDYVDQL